MKGKDDFADNSEIYQLNPIQIELLKMSQEDIKNGDLISEEEVKKMFAERMNKERGINKCVFCRSLFMRLV
ncbi:MAG: hypothetical protein ACI85I_002077 [Arenicella sp.]|jgi:hypothetical protein